MKNPSKSVLDYLSEIGSTGGSSGTGKAKARTRKQAQAAARASWAKRRKVKA